MERIIGMHASLWEESTSTHPFIRTTADGSIPEDAFNRWLMQDHKYVQGFLSFTEKLTRKALGEAQKVFQESEHVIKDELKWFEKLGASRGLDLSAEPPHSTTLAYLSFLEEVSKENLPYAFQAAAFYLTEAVYNTAWVRILEKQGPEGKYSVFASRWGSPEFTAYVKVLEGIAEAGRLDYLAKGGTQAEFKAVVSHIFERLLRLEVAFWDMAIGTYSTDLSEQLPWEVNFKLVAVGSSNPVKVDSVQQGLSQALHGKYVISVIALDVPSGVSDQPFSDDETARGANNRAVGAYNQFHQQHGYFPDLGVGIEGGLVKSDGDVYCAAWVVIYDGSHFGKGRSSAFLLPPPIVQLVNQGMELGAADDQVFNRVDSKRGSGTVGHLTKGIISRTDYYVPAVVLAFLPFQWKQLYFEA